MKEKDPFENILKGLERKTCLQKDKLKDFLTFENIVKIACNRRWKWENYLEDEISDLERLVYNGIDGVTAAFIVDKIYSANEDKNEIPFQDVNLTIDELKDKLNKTASEKENVI